MSVLTNQSQVSPGQSFYAPAGGGGGGGGGPNLLVSTIGVNPTGSVSFFQDSNLDSPAINFFTDASNTSAINFGVLYGANEGQSGAGAGVALALATNAVGTPYAALTCYQVQLCDSYGNLASVLEAGPTPGSCYVSSFYVSSINGATPGGGGGSVGPVLSNISSILMNPASATIDLTSASPGILTITNGLTPASNDIRLFTNENANNFVTNFQPNGQANLIQTLSPNSAGVALNCGSTDAGAAVIASADMANGNASTLTICSDNLILKQPVASDATLELTASDLNLYDVAVIDSNAALVSRVSIGLIGGRNQVYIDSNAQIGNQLWVSSIQNCREAFVSSFNVSSINGAAPGGTTISTFPGLTVSSPTAAILTLNGGANEIVARSDNTASATIWATGAGGLNLSTITTINGGAPLVAGNTPQATPFIQSGYASAVPYGSTILFNVPYNNDNLTVMLTATNAGVSGGANPNISLASAFGTNGVSSIGFQADTRDNGVGYAGSFHWMVMPRC